MGNNWITSSVGVSSSADGSSRALHLAVIACFISCLCPIVENAPPTPKKDKHVRFSWPLLSRGLTTSMCKLTLHYILYAYCAPTQSHSFYWLQRKKKAPLVSDDGSKFTFIHKTMQTFIFCALSVVHSASDTLPLTYMHQASCESLRGMISLGLLAKSRQEFLTFIT